MKPHLFHATLTANGSEYTSTGRNIAEALGNIPLEWLALKTKSILELKQGDKRAYKELPLFQGRRMLRSDLRRSVLSKQLAELLR